MPTADGFRQIDSGCLSELGRGQYFGRENKTLLREILDAAGKNAKRGKRQ